MSILDLSSLNKAIEAFERACNAAHDDKLVSQLTVDLREVIKAGVIQNFEFTYEVAWKFMKRWLEKNYSSSYVDGVTRRELFRLAAENHIIDDVDEWMYYHQARNQTSHTYDAQIDNEIYLIAMNFLTCVQKFQHQLQNKND